MRAWVVREFGEPADVLRLAELPDPQPGPNQVLIRVQAAACNFFDILLCQGRYQVKPDLPFVLGAEVAGEIIAVGDAAAGPDVSWQVGDRVISYGLAGGYAELIAVDQSQVRPWPAGMTPGQAAGMFITYQTGYCALHHRARLQPGETLLVHAAASGVGTAAVQLGKAAGARVIGTAGGPRKCEAVAALGADEVIDYSQSDVVHAVRERTGGRGADVIFDPVGGDVFDASRRVVAFEGRILVIGFTSGRFADAPTNHVLVKGYSVVGVHWGRYVEQAPELVAEWQAALAELWAARKIDPVVGAELPLADAQGALQRLADRGTVGKIVLFP